MYYIGAGDGLAAIYVKPQIGAASMYYAHKDHLGSIVSLTNSAGTSVFQANYDAWGRQTIVLNTIGFYRGYTGHEHLLEFGLINMNGRIYDPLLGRFLSPDNYVQAADFSQSFNRYSYCLNNPLAFTDPSGEFWHIVIGAAVGGIINTIAHADQIRNPGHFLSAFGIGAVGGALAAATGGAALSAYGTTAAVSMGAGGFIGGTVAGGVSYTFGIMSTSMGNSMIFGDPMPTGKQFLTGLGISMATTGTLQGINAFLHGRNFFTGNLPTPMPTPMPMPALSYNSPESKLNNDGMRTQLRSMPQDNLNQLDDASNQLNLVKVNTGGENYSYYPSTGENGVFVSGPNGQNIKIPSNYYQTPANNGNGIVFRPIGTSPASNANAIRIMGSTSYAPNGYSVFYNNFGQPINPATGQTLPRSLYHFKF